MLVGIISVPAQVSKWRLLADFYCAAGSHSKNEQENITFCDLPVPCKKVQQSPLGTNDLQFEQRQPFAPATKGI